MNRVVAPGVSKYFAEEHRAHGVTLICDTRVVCLEGQDGSNTWFAQTAPAMPPTWSSSASEPCNHPTRERRRVGRDNGIVVDEYCRTSDAAIYARAIAPIIRRRASAAGAPGIRG